MGGGTDADIAYVTKLIQGRGSIGMVQGPLLASLDPGIGGGKGTSNNNAVNNNYLSMLGITNDAVEEVRTGIVNFGKDFIQRFNKNIIEPYGEVLYNTQPVFYDPETGELYVLMSKEESEIIAKLMTGYVISNAAQGALEGLDKVNSAKGVQGASGGKTYWGSWDEYETNQL
ncbi:hypothetical protein [Alkaliphilus crotonatoxidans]